MDLVTRFALVEKAGRAPDEATAIRILIEGGDDPDSAAETAGIMFGRLKGDVLPLPEGEYDPLYDEPLSLDHPFYSEDPGAGGG